MKIPIRQVMTRGVEAISAAATLEEAAKAMRTHNVGILPVLENEKLAGVITDRDIAVRAVSARMRPEMTRVRDIMTPKVIACYEDQDIKKASLLLENNLIHRLIVLDRIGKLVGLVSLSDIASKTRKEALSGHVLSKVSAA